MTRYRSPLAVAALLVLTESFYLRPGFLRGTEVLAGSDYDELHMRRLLFVRDALFGARHTLPAWYPHEVLGIALCRESAGPSGRSTRFVTPRPKH